MQGLADKEKYVTHVVQQEQHGARAMVATCDRYKDEHDGQDVMQEHLVEILHALVNEHQAKDALNVVSHLTEVVQTDRSAVDRREVRE